MTTVCVCTRLDLLLKGMNTRHSGNMGWVIYCSYCWRRYKGKQGSVQQEQELWYTKQAVGMLILKAIAP